MTSPSIAIIDYGLGNVKSMLNAFRMVGANAILTNTKSKILSADALVLPGVGSFPYGMKQLEKYDLINVIHDFVSTNKPFMGVCLGMQMMFNNSNEFGKTKGLELIEGSINKLEVYASMKQKLPHIGWNNIKRPPHITDWGGTALSNIKSGTDMYFVHSYAATCDSSDDILAVTEFSGSEFCSAIKKNRIYGFQFHPEKSAAAGLSIINNFVSIILIF